MVLGKDEFYGIIMVQYKITPKDLPQTCDVCCKKHSQQHLLQFKTGMLIGACHDNAYNGLGLVAS
eukprot:12914664-Ditylum_brightwellii.AAC.1